MIFQPNDDESYHQWLEKNESGFVINSDKTLSNPNYPMLHRAMCGHINDRNTPNYTTAHYMKLCSTNRQELIVWAQKDKKRRLKILRIALLESVNLVFSELAINLKISRYASR
jgi:hypothetical protein